jgi:RNA polymerase sigma-70 factor (sigma-E family)
MRDDDTDHDPERRRFTEYFAAHRESVRRTAYLICGDWHWAEDLTQNAFIRLAQGWHRIRDPRAMDAYLRTCLVRAYLAEVRRVWRRRERPVAEAPEPAVVGDDAEDTVRRVVFAEALGRLPPRQRVTLVCRYYQGLDVAETATVLGCSEGTVKSQTARGLVALRRELGSAVVPPEPIVVER